MRRIVPLVSMRHTVLVLAAMIALALVLASGVAPKPADAATRIVTKTFSNPGQITINDSGAATPYPSTRNVQGFNQGKILDVNLVLKNFSHTHPDDVDVMLSKIGKNRTVMSDVGGSTDIGPSGIPPTSSITLKLDDQASSPLPDEGSLVGGGSFRPTNKGSGSDGFPMPAPPQNGLSALSGFNGLNPNGTWHLRVIDDAGVDVGEFAGGWSITIKARVNN